jgi:acetyltransferase-like isoleucine patch superfamily enzyme
MRNARGRGVARIWAMMRKKLLLIVAHSFPLNSARVWALRRAGYQVGREVYIGQDFLVVDELDLDSCKLSIGDRVAIAPRALVVLASYPNNSRLRGELRDALGNVTIGDDAWIGAGAIILPNVTIGEQAVVASGGVVRKDVLARTIVGGVPGRVIGSLDGRPTRPETE